MKIVRDDGGRAAAGYPSLLLQTRPGGRSGHGDCACRSVSIATGVPYGQVHLALAKLVDDPGMVDTGVPLGVSAKYLMSIGWSFTLNRFEHSRGRVSHRTLQELAARGGRYVIETRCPAQGFGHISALVDGELRDLDGELPLEEFATRALYGWWQKARGRVAPLPPQYLDMSQSFVPATAAG